MRAAGVELDTVDYDLGGAPLPARRRRSCPTTSLDELRGLDAILLGAVGTPDVPPGVHRAGPAAQAALRARPVHQPAPVRPRPNGHRLRRHPREHRGHLRRRGRLPAQGHAARDRHPGLGEHPHGRRALRPLRLRAGRDPAPRSTSRWCTRPTCSPSPATCGSARSTRWPPSTPTSTTAYNHVDAACIYFVQDPERYDVIVTDNLFGDILTDLGGAVSGGIGLAASANLNPARTGPSMFEPVHGSAPDIVGTGKANPIAAILSAAMMLEFLGEADAAARIRKACAEAADARPAPPPRSATRSQGGSERMPITADREDLDGRRARRLGRRQDPHPHPHAALRHAACSRASAPTRPTQGPAVFRLTDHIKRLLQQRQDLHDRHPVHGRASWSRRPRTTVRANGLAVLLHPADRLPRLRRDGPQPAAVPGERVHRRAGRGAPTSATRASANGVRMKIRSWQRHDPNTMPPAAKGTGMYINSSMAKVEALKAGYDEAILLIAAGLRVASAPARTSSSCSDGRIITPPVVGGRARGHHPGLGDDHRPRPRLSRSRVGNLLRSDLYIADEAFLSGTAAEVVPIRSVDDREIGEPGPITRRIQETYFASRARRGRPVQGLDRACRDA